MSNQFSIDPLFDFQILCDIDYGLYKLIKEDYYDRDIFDNYLFDSTDERFIKTSLVSRDHINPLFIFCKKDVLSDEEKDNLYQQFLDEEYQRMLDLSCYTSIMEVASTSNNVNKLVNVTVLCANEKEKDWVVKHNRKLKCIVADYDNFDISRYDTIYIKDVYTLNRFNQDSIDGKNIIIPRYLFNLEAYHRTELPIIEVSQKYYKDNKFMVADIYKDIRIPVTEMK